MGLSELIKQGPPRSTKRCVVGVIIDSLEKDDSKALEDAIAQLAAGSAPFSAAWLQRILISEGHKISENSLSKHINKRCACATK